MEFREKIQALRAQAGLTQEQLAERLFVSRVTVSKWESGRGYPNIDSLKLMAKVFSVSIDDLLSGDELMTIAESQSREVAGDIRSLVFGVLDLMFALLLVLPFFGEPRGDHVEAVSLMAITSYPAGILVFSYALVIVCSLFGVTELVLQNFRNAVWARLKTPISLGISALAVLFFMLTREPYVSSFLFFALLVKGLMLLKTR